MFAKRLVTLLALLAVFTGSASAQSASYHLERLDIQGRAFLDTFGPSVAAPIDPQTPLDTRLQGATDNSLWAHQMVVDDATKIVESGREWAGKLQKATPDELGTARTTLESLARRLRVSTSAVNLTEESRTALSFLFLELEEASKALEVEKAQLLAQQASRRSRVQIGFGLGYGYGYGNWGYPWGVGSYYPYGYGFGPGPYYPGLPYPGYPW